MEAMSERERFEAGVLPRTLGEVVVSVTVEVAGDEPEAVVQ